jgi:HPt (histidine-containing phosphotransfer) domain-containing protein
MEAHSIQDGHATRPDAQGGDLGHSTASVSGLRAREGAVDVGRIAESIGLGPKIVLELLQVFVVASQSDLTRIEQAIRTANMRDVAEAAHSLKGAALSFEFNDISSAARGLELAARDGAVNGAAETIEIIRVRLEAIARSISMEKHRPA